MCALHVYVYLEWFPFLDSDLNKMGTVVSALGVSLVFLAMFMYVYTYLRIHSCVPVVKLRKLDFLLSYLLIGKSPPLCLF